MELVEIDWKNISKKCEELARKTEHFRPDTIVAISRGGLVPGRIISDVLCIRNILVLGIEFYRKAGETIEMPKITQDVQADLSGKKVLIVDDVADSGKTIKTAKKRIVDKGAKKVRIATLHYKPNSIIKPDWYVEKTTKWIVYPWEAHETKKEIKKILPEPYGFKICKRSGFFS